MRPIYIVIIIDIAKGHTAGGYLERGVDGGRGGGDGEVPAGHATQGGEVLVAAAPVLERVDLKQMLAKV